MEDDLSSISEVNLKRSTSKDEEEEGEEEEQEQEEKKQEKEEKEQQEEQEGKRRSNMEQDSINEIEDVGYFKHKSTTASVKQR